MDLKEFVKLSRKIGFPRTQDTDDDTKVTKYRKVGRQYMYWRKSGGYAGAKMIRRVLEKAKKAGFKPQEFKSDMSPDGYQASSGQSYVKTLRGKVVATLRYSDHYGVTRYENSFSLTLSGAPEQEESDELE